MVAADVVQAANDKQQLAPMLGTIDALPAELGRPETRLADSGYFSAANVTVCQAAEIEPLIAAGRQHHHPSLHERFAAAGPAPDHPTLVEAMAHHLPGVLQAMGHGLYQGWMVRRRPGRGEALVQGGMMMLPARGDQWLDRCSLADRDVRRAEIAAVGQPCFWPAEFRGNASIVPSIGASCCLSLAACTTSAATTSNLASRLVACKPDLADYDFRWA